MKYTKHIDGSLIIYETEKFNLEFFHNARGSWSVRKIMLSSYSTMKLFVFPTKAKALEFIKKELR